MKFIRSREVYGGPIAINLEKVERITQESEGATRIWFSGDDRDSVVIAQNYERITEAIGCVSI